MATTYTETDLSAALAGLRRAYVDVEALTQEANALRQGPPGETTERAAVRSAQLHDVQERSGAAQETLMAAWRLAQDIELALKPARR